MVNKSPYHAARVNVSRNTIFSSEEKHFLWLWYCSKKQIEIRGLYCYRQGVCFITLFPNIFSYCFCILSEFAKVFERKVWRIQTAHLHNAARALSNPSRCFQFSRQRFISLCLIWWQKTNRMWFSVVCTLIDNDTHHHSGQNVADSLGCTSWVHNILTTVMTCIVVDKSTHHTKPPFDLLNLQKRTSQLLKWYLHLLPDYFVLVAFTAFSCTNIMKNYYDNTTSLSLTLLFTVFYARRGYSGFF